MGDEAVALVQAAADLDLLLVTDDLDRAVRTVLESYGRNSAESPTDARKADAQ